MEDGLSRHAEFVSFAEVLGADPGKLIPLRGPAVLAGLALLSTLFDALSSSSSASASSSHTAGAVAVAASAADALLSAGAVLAFSRVVEVLLMERDDVLASSAARASTISAALRRGELWRVKHEFTADPIATAAAAAAATEDADVVSSSSSSSSPLNTEEGAPTVSPLPPLPSTGVPCFTLRRPLGAGEERRLNLFEPRWLALMDRLAEENGGRLEGAELGCMLGVNRRYVSADWLSRAAAGGGAGAGAVGTKKNNDGERRGVPGSRSDTTPPEGGRGGGSGGGGGFGGTRSADLVVEPWLRKARVLRVTEGRRRVTGARKLEVWIEGGPDVIPEVAGLKAHPAGYLVADVDSPAGTTTGPTGTGTGTGLTGAETGTDTVRCVCVVGLAHCNGLVARLSEMELEGWR